MSQIKPDRSKFLKELKESFPELKQRINSEEGLSTFEMDAFCEFTQRHIDEGNKKVVQRCFEIAGRYFLYSNNKFREIIDTCYVEPLEFKDSNRTQRNWAWEIFPAQLKERYESFWGKSGT